VQLVVSAMFSSALRDRGSHLATVFFGMNPFLPHLIDLFGNFQNREASLNAIVNGNLQATVHSWVLHVT
jgi:hypothetical protein